ncbi:MAG TPA: hypothetical protein VFS69_04065, partial [Sphingomicrobium sp.]|nr:hypothetical protein [Sphingomicrobium sp.]
ASAAPAQPVTSYRAENPPQAKSDADKIVCQKEEKIGTRLGAKKVCMTVAEWEARKAADRDQLERTQSGARAPCSNDGGCDPASPF